MEIIVLNKKVETKEIVSIVDIEENKTMFLNREAGFIINRIDKPSLRFGQSIPYESYPHEISGIKERWAAIQKKVEDQWQKDKSDLIIIE